MDWDLIQSTLKAQVELILGPDFDVQWGPRISAGWRPTSFCKLEVVSVAKSGQDYNRYTDVGGGVLESEAFGDRILTVQALIETASQELVRSAWPAAERVTVGMKAPAVRQALCDATLAVSDTRIVNSQTFIGESREVSRVVVELVFLSYASWIDSSQDGFPVDTVVVESDTLKQPDGSDAPDQINIEGP